VFQAELVNDNDYSTSDVLCRKNQTIDESPAGL
jgi:hypothetical protein